MNVQPQIESATDIRASARPTNLNAGLEPLAEFAAKAQELAAALGALSGISGGRVSQSLARLKAELEAFEPSVTLLGQVKSGKTSLVNAMAGWADLLPSDVNPWTSVVTSLHLQPGERRQEGKACFQFMTEEEWDRLLTKGGRIGEMAGRAGAGSELQKIRAQIEEMRARSRQRLGRKFELLMGQKHEYGYFDKNLIERYICLGDDFDEPEESGLDEQGRFADITRAADLYLNCRTVPHRLCLRDTPGVNDTFMMREQITIQAIRDSRICVVVLSAGQALTSVDMGLIRMISNLQSREVVIFVNRIDELAEPATQAAEIEASIRQTLETHHGPKDATIIFGSAYWANKVLTGELEDMEKASSAALLDWAQATVNASNAKHSAQNMVWELSGLPALNRAISERIVSDLGEPQLARIASAAVTAATGQEAANAIRVQGAGGAAHGSLHDTRAAFEEIAQSHLRALESEIDAVLEAYRARADRAHATFTDRATHALIEHLEKWGEEAHWEYDPAGLRMLLRTAYSVMSKRLQAAAHMRYEAAVQDIAGVLYDGFGTAVEGIQLSVPDVPPPGSPVVLGQAIALDFNDSWWAAWWRRTRGYKAFAKRFRSLIEGETEDFMTQLKTVQTADARAAILGRLQEFFEGQRDILLELADCSRAGGDMQELFTDQDDSIRRRQAGAALETLRSFIV
ncbi:dynamin family protein [Leisingera sp. ANG-M1]|uniref:dynamin family protein n=1 Tax=Leisingera sp. ANG-M1 TaxID=1577895 RepID=UPI00068DAA9D|nr:dynamin family protein [Leisingera sp. ANG-M1]